MSVASSDDTVLNGWSVFFTKLAVFLRQNGNLGLLTEYVMQRMDMEFSTCSCIN